MLDHLAPDCPRFPAIRNDPFARRAILRLFRDDPSPSGPSRPRPICELATTSPAPVIAAINAVASDASVSSDPDADTVVTSNPSSTPDFR